MGRKTMSFNNTQIDFSTMSNLKNFVISYHDNEDTLFVHPEKPKPATSFDLDGEVWVRLNLNNGEVVGLEIEDFETVFLKKYPELAIAWKEAKPLLKRKKHRKYEETNRKAFLRIIVEFFQEFLRENPPQASFGIMPVH